MQRKVFITYFAHGPIVDNEKGIATGWLSGELSNIGIQQLKKLKKSLTKKRFDAIFCSDLKRAIDSAKIIFSGTKIPIIPDARLRECDYGSLNGASAEEVEKMAEKCIESPFPSGESYNGVEKRIRNFLADLSEHYAGKSIAIVSHKAPQLALEVITKGKTWQQAIKEDWRNKKPKEWKPGWEYTFSINWNAQYNKLVRDKIPEIIKKDGFVPITHFALDEEYLQKLKEKLKEETQEFIENNSEEELADLLEIIYALCYFKRIKNSSLEKSRKNKAKERGAFKKRIILEEIKAKGDA